MGNGRGWSPLRSSTGRWARIVAVEVRRGTLGADGHCSGGSRGGDEEKEEKEEEEEKKEETGPTYILTTLT